MGQLEITPFLIKLWQITLGGVNGNKFGDWVHASVHSDIF
jgi:hypothetical protein